MNNIIECKLESTYKEIFTGFWQHDYGQILRITGVEFPKAVEIQFSLNEKSGSTITRIGTTVDGATEVQIPNELLKNDGRTYDYCIYAYIYLTDETSGSTEYEIVLRVKSRTKPENPSEEPLPEPNIFHETVAAVNASAERAEMAEQNANASATEAGKYASSASESAVAAEKTKEDALKEVGEKKREAIEAIQEQEETSVGKITTHTDVEIQRIQNQIAKSKGELEQTVANAGVSKEELEQSIETASDTKTALDESTELAETAKTELDTSTQKAGTAKNALDESIEIAGTVNETLSATVKQAGALDTSLGEKIETGTQLKTDIVASGEKAVKDIQTAGSEQLSKMQAVAEEFTADREQITTNKEDIGSLKEDLDYKIDKTAVGERELKFTNIGYVNASDGTISRSKKAQNTGFCRIDGVSRIIAHVNLSEAGAKIAFYSRNKEYLKDISIIPAITDPNYTKTDLDITSDAYANAKYCIVSNYGSEQKIAKVIGTVAPYSAKVTADEAKVTADEAKVTADEAKVTADEAITPYKTTFFDEVNIGVPENVENVQRITYNDGLVDSVSNTWSLIFKCKPNTDYYIHVPNRNRKNAAESENDKFVDGETYTILPTSVINYSGVDVVKITTGENAKRIMFYYFNGSYDYDANKDKIIILQNKWVVSPYAHIPSQYLPKDIVKKSKHYGTFAIIGDSYSSFKGYMADPNAATWYPASDHNMNDTNDVENVEQTWWYKFANTYNSRLLENNSCSGSTIAYDSYSEGLDDGKETSFIQRMNLITTPQLILIYGGTNDSWVAGDTKRDDFLGEYKYSDFSESDFIYFRPALAYLLDKLKHKHIGAKIIFMLNSSLSNIKESVHEICSHYEIGVCEITDIALAHSHPTDEGMTTIAKQIIEFLEVS